MTDRSYLVRGIDGLPTSCDGPSGGPDAMARWSTSAPGVSCGLDLGGQGFRQAFQVQDPANQVTLLAHTVKASPAEPTKAMPVLALPEQLLDLLAAALRQAIGEAAGTHADPRVRRLPAAAIDRDVRRDVARQHARNERLD